MGTYRVRVAFLIVVGPPLRNVDVRVSLCPRLLASLSTERELLPWYNTVSLSNDLI